MQRRSTLAGEEKIRQMTINKAVKDRDTVNEDVCCLIYAKGLPFKLVKSPFFEETLESVGNYGKGNQPPIYNEARITYFQKEVERIDKVDLKKYKKEWSRTCYTLMSDG